MAWPCRDKKQLLFYALACLQFCDSLALARWNINKILHYKVHMSVPISGYISSTMSHSTATAQMDYVCEMLDCRKINTYRDQGRHSIILFQVEASTSLALHS